jgi:hypothetical protein
VGYCQGEGVFAAVPPYNQGKRMNESQIKWFAAVERNHTPLFVDIYLRGLIEEDQTHRTGLNISFLNMKKEFRSMYVDLDELKRILLSSRRIIQTSYRSCETWLPAA